MATEMAAPLAPAPVPHDATPNCMRCGLCLAVCPTYREVGIETASPRGRLALIRAVEEGVLSLSDNFVAHMYRCLDCMACTAACPSGVQVNQLILGSRARINGARREPFLRSFLLRQVVPSPRRLDLALWPLRLYQASGLQELVRRLGLWKALPQGHWEQVAPPIAIRPLRHRLPEVTPAQGPRRYRVGFFLGCAQDLVFADAGGSTVAVLAKNGCEVVVPRGLQCCGKPHLNYGEGEVARRLARHNIALFQQAGVEAIVTDCATCGAFTKEYRHLLADDDRYATSAGEFSGKVQDISQFLMRTISLESHLGEIKERVTYHDPCHLARGQGVSQEPRELLRAIPGLELVEMKEADWCCGGAGTYNLTHHELSMKILDRKMANARATEATLIASGCPACLIQLDLGIRRSGARMQAIHPIQLLARAYRLEEGQ